MSASRLCLVGTFTIPPTQPVEGRLLALGEKDTKGPFLPSPTTKHIDSFPDKGRHCANISLEITGLHVPITHFIREIPTLTA